MTSAGRSGGRGRAPISASASSACGRDLARAGAGELVDVGPILVPRTASLGRRLAALAAVGLDDLGVGRRRGRGRGRARRGRGCRSSWPDRRRPDRRKRVEGVGDAAAEAPTATAGRDARPGRGRLRTAGVHANRLLHRGTALALDLIVKGAVSPLAPRRRTAGSRWVTDVARGSVLPRPPQERRTRPCIAAVTLRSQVGAGASPVRTNDGHSFGPTVTGGAERDAAQCRRAKAVRVASIAFGPATRLSPSVRRSSERPTWSGSESGPVAASTPPVSPPPPAPFAPVPSPPPAPPPEPSVADAVDVDVSVGVEVDVDVSVGVDVDVDVSVGVDVDVDVSVGVDVEVEVSVGVEVSVDTGVPQTKKWTDPRRCVVRVQRCVQIEPRKRAEVGDVVDVVTIATLDHHVAGGVTRLDRRDVEVGAVVRRRDRDRLTRKACTELALAGRVGRVALGDVAVEGGGARVTAVAGAAREHRVRGRSIRATGPPTPRRGTHRGRG